MPIRIISTYAPHNERPEEEKQQHWEDVKVILNKTCKRHHILWGAGASGQLGHRNQAAEKKYAKKEHGAQKII